MRDSFVQDGGVPFVSVVIMMSQMSNVSPKHSVASNVKCFLSRRCGGE